MGTTSGSTVPDEVVTREEYDKMTPYQKGFIQYWQGAWNALIPKDNPYEDGSKDSDEFNRGQFQAMINAQDSEE